MELGKNAVFVILVIAVLAIGAYLFVNTNSVYADETISVQGISEIKADPEIVSIYFDIETLEDSAQDSEQENSDINLAVRQSLEDLGFSESEIETLSFNVYEEFDWTEQGRKSKGFKTVHSMKLEMDEFDFVGVTIDEIVDNGALVRAINFEISQETENDLKAQALEEATKDAKNKAEAVARGSGGKLGKLVNINTNDYSYRPYVAYAESSGASLDEAKSSFTQISTRDITVNAFVQATYEIK